MGSATTAGGLVGTGPMGTLTSEDIKRAYQQANVDQGWEKSPAQTASEQMMAGLKAAMGSGGATGGATAPTLGPAPPTIAAPTAPKATSTGQAFATAKDASSRIANKALDALRSQMVSRGIEGSGVEEQGVADILSGAQQQQSGAAYDAAKTEDERNWDAAQLGYQGAITQRGQDIGLSEAAYSGQIAQQNAMLQQMQALAALISAMGGMGSY